MAKAKFTKAQVIATITDRMESLQKKHKFDPRNGWAQVEGKDTAVIVDYGRYDELGDLLDLLSDF